MAVREWFSDLATRSMFVWKIKIYNFLMIPSGFYQDKICSSCYFCKSGLSTCATDDQYLSKTTVLSATQYPNCANHIFANIDPLAAIEVNYVDDA